MKPIQFSREETADNQGGLQLLPLLCAHLMLDAHVRVLRLRHRRRQQLVFG